MAPGLTIGPNPQNFSKSKSKARIQPTAVSPRRMPNTPLKAITRGRYAGCQSNLVLQRSKLLKSTSPIIVSRKPMPPLSPHHHHPHHEKHYGSSAALRDLVVGMSDGLTVPFALAAGLSGAV